MSPRILLSPALVLCGILFTVTGCHSTGPSVYLDTCPSPPSPDKLKQIYADSDYQFVWATHDTQATVLVFSQKKRGWKRIAKVSLENARLGHQPRVAQIYMDFSKIYRGKDYAPLPLRTSMDGTSGFSIPPDKIDFDANRNVYRVFFNSSWHDDAVTTQLEILKSDLDGLFNEK